MTLAYPQKEGTGYILWVTRLLVSSGMGAAVILGLVAIRRRDITSHRAWMTRAYALALGAGTRRSRSASVRHCSEAGPSTTT